MRLVYSLLLVSIILMSNGVTSAVNGTIQLVSVPGPVGEDGISGSPVISADGRFVAFDSSSSNLVADDTNGFYDIFVFDTLSNITERISLSSNGEQSNGGSSMPSISADGRFVSFFSAANNLVDNDNNDFGDIFIRDRWLNTTERISMATNGSEANLYCLESSISGDGRYVVFSSWANNLVINDVNDLCDVFVRDRFLNITELVSISTNGSQQSKLAEGYEYPINDPIISADGRFVVFSSFADNLVVNDTNLCKDVFLRDLILNTTILISRVNNGSQAEGNSFNPDISANCRYVVFVSEANNLVENDTRGVDFFVRDMLTGVIRKVSFFSEEEEIDSGNPSISADGRFVVFDRINYVSSSSLEIPLNSFISVSPISSSYSNVFLYDCLKNTTWCISKGYYGEDSNAYSTCPSISADGKKVVFESWASNLVLNHENYFQDIFLYSWQDPFDINVTIPPLESQPGKNITNKSTTSNSKKNNNIQNTHIKHYSIFKPEFNWNGLSRVINTPASQFKANFISNNSDQGMMDYYFNEFFIKTNITTDSTKSYLFLMRSLSPPFGIQGLSQVISEYTTMKFSEAINKAWQSGNFWDFWDYTFFHFYGYSNLDHTWGGENIKMLLYFAFGIEGDGDLSIGNLIINLLSIVPITRIVSLFPKLLPKLINRVGIKLGLLLKENIILNKLTLFLGNITAKFGLKNMKTWENIYSTVSNFALPNPFSLLMMPLDALAKLTGNKRFINIITGINTFESKRGVSEFLSLLFGPDPVGKIKGYYGNLGEFLTKNGVYINNSVKNMVNNEVNTVKKIIPPIINKATKIAKGVTQTIVNTTKKVVKEVSSTIHAVKKTVVNTTKKVVKKALTLVKKTVTTVKKAVNTTKTLIKKTVSKTKTAVKNVITAGKTLLKKIIWW